MKGERNSLNMPFFSDDSPLLHMGNARYLSCLPSDEITSKR